MSDQKPYDKNDNDTYTETLSTNPVMDAEYHMFRDPKGHIRSGGIMGYFSEESRQKAENNVLRFPKPTATGLKHINDLKLPTLMPMSLVQRYNLSETNLIHRQRTPVFFDTKEEQFVVLLDHRFLRDIDVKELDIKGMNCKVYNDKSTQGRYLGLLSPSINGFREGGNAFIDAIHEVYKAYNISLKEGEKVIVLRHMLRKNIRTELFSLKADQHLVGHGIETDRFDIEYAICVRFGSRYYICDDNGEIIQNSAFELQKDKEQRVESSEVKESLSLRIKGAPDECRLLILDYSEPTLSVIQAIVKKLHSIHSELSCLFELAVDRSRNIDGDISGARKTFLLGENHNKG